MNNIPIPLEKIAQMTGACQNEIRFLGDGSPCLQQYSYLFEHDDAIQQMDNVVSHVR